MRVGSVEAGPVLPAGDAVQVPGAGEKRLVPGQGDFSHLVLVLLLVSFPHMDEGVWFQLRRGQQRCRGHGNSHSKDGFYLNSKLENYCAYLSFSGYV